MLPLSNHLQQQKAAMRRMMEVRRAAAMAQVPDAALKLRDVFLNGIVIPDGSIVASYHAHGSEINPLPLTNALRARGHRIALPAMIHRDHPLVFYAHELGDTLIINDWGIPEPERTAPVVEPDVFLVPLLAFNRRGYRLGYGGGYYDHSLAFFRRHKTILAIGLGFACQEVTEIPTGPHDIKLNRIVTELQVY